MTDDKKPVKKKVTRAPKKEKLQLLRALEFVNKANKKGGDATQTHTRLANGYAVAFNHIIACGYPIQETDLNVCAHTETLLKALKKFKDGDSITQSDMMTLSLRMGKIHAKIPCVNPAVIHPVEFDVATIPVTDKLIEGFQVLDKFVSKGGKSIVASSLLLRNGSMFATDLKVLVEFWHGVTLPQNSIIPKEFITAVLKVKSAAKFIGYGTDRLIITFEDNSWIRTQLYAEEWPEVDSQMPQPLATSSIPSDFFEGIEEVLPFCTDDKVYLTEHGLSSTLGATESVYSILNLPVGAYIEGSKILRLENHVRTMQISEDKKQVAFFGEFVRVACLVE